MNVTQICEEANEYRKNGEFEKAIAKYGEALKIDAKNPKVYNALGQVFSDIEDYKQAVANFDKAIELNTKFAEAYLNRGRAYFQIGDIDKSLADLSKCLLIAPTFDLAYHVRGRIYADLEKFEEAIEDFTIAIETVHNGPMGQFMNDMPNLDSRNVMSYSARGEAYLSISEYEKALDDFNRCIALTPEESYNYYLRGLTFAQTDETAKAVKDLTKAIELYPDGGLYYNFRGNLYANSKKFDLAIKDYTKAIAIEKDAAIVYQNRANVFAEIGETKKALKDYKKAIKLYDTENDEDNIKECEDAIEQLNQRRSGPNKPIYSFQVDEYVEEEFSNETGNYKILNFGIIDNVYLVKICTEDHRIGISLEYSWIESNFPNHERILQQLNTISINGALLPADILTITEKKSKNKQAATKKIVFDISDFFDNPIDDYDEDGTNGF